MTRELLAKALDVMQQHAASIGVRGAAVTGFLKDGNSVDWTVDLRIIGALKTVNAEGKGYNFAGVVFQKASEAMDTHQNSGSKVRPVLNGECGWQGCVITEAGEGFVLAAFSGGTSDQDVVISQKGLEVLKAGVMA